MASLEVSFAQGLGLGSGRGMSSVERGNGPILPGGDHAPVYVRAITFEGKQQYSTAERN